MPGMPVAGELGNWMKTHFRMKYLRRNNANGMQTMRRCANSRRTHNLIMFWCDLAAASRKYLVICQEFCCAHKSWWHQSNETRCTCTAWAGQAAKIMVLSHWKRAAEFVAWAAGQWRGETERMGMREENADRRGNVHLGLKQWLMRHMYRANWKLKWGKWSGLYRRWNFSANHGSSKNFGESSQCPTFPTKSDRFW